MISLLRYCLLDMGVRFDLKSFLDAGGFGTYLLTLFGFPVFAWLCLMGLACETWFAFELFTCWFWGNVWVVFGLNLPGFWVWMAA